MMRKADVSFEELYNCYKVRFERFAISYIQDRSVAEDIVTDSFVYWWEHRDRVGSKDENPAASRCFSLAALTTALAME